MLGDFVNYWDKVMSAAACKAEFFSSGIRLNFVRDPTPYARK